MTNPEALQEALKQLREQLASAPMPAVSGMPFAMDPDELWHEEMEGAGGLAEAAGAGEAAAVSSSSLSAKGQPAHPIDILRAEHNAVLEFLDRLSELVDRIQGRQGAGPDAETLDRLREVTALLVEADKHHRREEEALFPVMQEDGMAGPTWVMQVEHKALRAQVERLTELLAEPGALSPQEVSRGLVEAGKYVASVLREHIAKEEALVYPAALYGLKPEYWLLVLEKSEAVGYCSFAPLKGRPATGEGTSAAG
jgi:hypothetical protein